MRFLVSILCVLFFLNCTQNIRQQEQTDEIINSEKKLKSFLKKFKILPYENMVLSFEFENLGKGLPQLDSKTSDTLFVSYAEGAKAYGMMPDTSKFYILLWYQAAENGALMMSTIDKKGTIISEQCLNSDQYAWDCGYQWHGKIYISKEKAILLRDSIVTYDCENGPAPDSTWKFEIDSMDGVITPKGNIQFSKLIKSIPQLIHKPK